MRYMVLVLFLTACAAPVPVSRATQDVSASPEPHVIDVGDRVCVEDAVRALFAAMNVADEVGLRRLLGSASFGIGEGAVMYPEEGIARLVARSRAGERWSLLRLDVNGRGGAGGVNFGLRMQRAGPGIPIADVDGKGALDCPGEKFLVFFTA
jgi:hypothetical protein